MLARQPVHRGSFAHSHPDPHGRCHNGTVSDDHQAEYARRLADMLNEGVLQDAVPAGLEDQGQFELDVLDVLDALGSAGLKLVRDDQPESALAHTSLAELSREIEGSGTETS